MKLLKSKIPAQVFYAVIDLKNATLKIKDGDDNEIEVKLGTGNLTYSEKRNIEYVLDRGQLDTVREGDEVPVDVTLDSTWEWLRGQVSDADLPSVEEALKRIGNAASWVSTDADPCAPYAVDIEITNAPPCGDSDQEVITIADFRWESANHDMKGGTIAFAGKANVTQANVVRGPATT